VLLAVYAGVVPRLQAAVPLASALRLGDALPSSLLLGLVAGGAAVGLVGSAMAVFRTLRRS
jgi:cell division transport system permease protein